MIFQISFEQALPTANLASNVRVVLAAANGGWQSFSSFAPAVIEIRLRSYANLAARLSLQSFAVAANVVGSAVLQLTAKRAGVVAPSYIAPSDYSFCLPVSRAKKRRMRCTLNEFYGRRFLSLSLSLSFRLVPLAMLKIATRYRQTLCLVVARAPAIRLVHRFSTKVVSCTNSLRAAIRVRKSK